MKLNKEEIAVGALVGGAFIFFLKWWTVITIPLCAYLWALGGAERTSLEWRRTGVTVTLMAAFVASLWGEPYFWVLIPCAGLFYGATTIGYGIPDENDDGSALGAFMYNLVGGNTFWADILTRGTIGLVMGISWGYLAFFNIWGWLAGVIALMAGFPAIVRLI